MHETQNKRKTDTDLDTRRPKRYTVVMINDDFTPFEFVVDVLMKFLGQSRENAKRITMMIHRQGRCNVGLYTHEIAETKALQVIGNAKHNEYPLVCDVRPV